MTEWPPRFEEVVRRHLPGLDPAAQLDTDLVLADHGLDSLRTVSLLVAIEDDFDVNFPDELLAASIFATPEALWMVLAKLL